MRTVDPKNVPEIEGMLLAELLPSFGQFKMLDELLESEPERHCLAPLSSMPFVSVEST